MKSAFIFPRFSLVISLVALGLAADAVRAEVPPQAPAFARVYLSLRGCTSCSSCRSNIRQTVKAEAPKSTVLLDDEKVEVRYDAACEIPLDKVVETLARSRLHNLELVDVLFEGTGSVKSDGEGRGVFVVKETNQSFSLAFDLRQFPELSPDKPLRIVAVVEGWRETGQPLTLKLKEII